ncbi:outer membrane beta-barrel protein [Novosphingobium colocasiae]|uniref:outer membrane beta-barrel protein n=1 Tax=Novosphingobium colocasiae TaxID=1256513 RepID=UPI0035B1E1D1
MPGEMLHGQGVVALLAACLRGGSADGPALRVAVGRGMLCAFFGLGAVCLPQGAALAQVTSNILINPKVPDYMVPYQERSVSEQGDGDWAALGIRAGSFRVSPTASVGQSITSNAYATAKGTAAAFETIEADVKAQSEWARHSLALDAYRRIDFYVGHKDRKEDEWSLKASGDIDVTDADQISFDADLNRVVFNTLTSSDVTTTGAIVSMVYDHQAIGATRTFGAGRLLVQGERYHVNFLTKGLLPAASRTYRDHDIYQASLQGEYSFAPSFMVFSRFNYVKTDFGSTVSVSGSTQNSEGVRLIVGARKTISGLGRATVAVAYSRRTHASPAFGPVSGLSAQARVEVFLSALTTINGEIGNRIADTQLISTAATRDKYVQIGVDHALLRNFKLGADSRMVWQKGLIGSDPSKFLSLGFRGNYLASRRFEIAGRVSYTSRTYPQSVDRPGIKELTGGLTLTYRI